MGIDCFVFVLGFVYGFYKGELNFGFKEMEEIGNIIGFLLVFYGGIGILIVDIKKLILFGIVKINVNIEN